jgi:hypothetical protein
VHGVEQLAWLSADRTCCRCLLAALATGVHGHACMRQTATQRLATPVNPARKAPNPDVCRYQSHCQHKRCASRPDHAHMRQLCCITGYEALAWCPHLPRLTPYGSCCTDSGRSKPGSRSICASLTQLLVARHQHCRLVKLGSQGARVEQTMQVHATINTLVPKQGWLLRLQMQVPTSECMTQPNPKGSGQHLCKQLVECFVFRSKEQAVLLVC